MNKDNMEDLYWSEEEQKEYEEAVFKDVAFNKGVAQGVEQRNIEIAKSLLENNVDINIIIKSTGLTDEEINELKEEINKD